MMRSILISWRLMVVGSVFVLLAGCAAQEPERPGPSIESAPSDQQSAPEEPGPDTSGPQGIALPGSCEEILSLDTMHSYDERLEHFTEGADAEAALASMLGPVTMSTLQSGAQQVYCGWGIRQTDAGAHLGVAVIDEQAKADLLVALRDSVFTEVKPVDGAEAMFVQGQSEAHRYMDEIVIGVDLLVVASHTISGDFARDAFAALQDEAAASNSQ